MNTKAFFPYGGGSNIILWTGTEKKFNFLRSTNKIQFFYEISTSGKKCQLNEGLKI